jgi:hypothetical protein
MPMTVKTMSAMVMAGLNKSNKRLLENEMVDRIPCYSSIYIYSYSYLNGFGVGLSEHWKTGKRKCFSGVKNQNCRKRGFEAEIRDPCGYHFANCRTVECVQQCL